MPGSPGCAATTTSSPVSSSSSSTTTVFIPAPLTATYSGTVTPAGPPQPPATFNLSLIFNASQGRLAPAGFFRNIRAAAVTYNVTGTFTLGSLNGTVVGTLNSADGTLNGTFKGVLSATLSNGCMAHQDYQGPMSELEVNWTPGTDTNNCGGASPLPQTPIHVPAGSMNTTTSTITTTTTSIDSACIYTLNPSSRTIGAAGGAGFSFTATRNTQNGCSWSASTSTPWITLTGATSGASPGVIVYSVAANPTTASRSGSIVIQWSGGNATFSVTQAGVATTTTTTSTSTSTTSTTTSTRSTSTTSTTTIPRNVVLVVH